LNATLRLPLHRVVGHPLLGMALAGLFFGAGWFVRYSIRHGMGGATHLFQQRLIDAFSFRPRPPKPDPSPSASPSPLTTAPSAASPSAPPAARPRRPPPPSEKPTIRAQVLDLLRGSPELQKTDKHRLVQMVQGWKNPGPAEILTLLEAVDKLLYKKDAARRGIIWNVLALTTVAELLKLDKTIDAERIAKGWDVPDIRKAFDTEGPPALKKLAAGRPAQFFIDLKKKWGPFQVCRDNLTQLKEAKARPESGASPATTPPRTGGATEPPAVECPDGGTYEQRATGSWTCTIHQSLDQPFPEAARLAWYIEPVEEALKTARMGQAQNGVDALAEVLRIHPGHVWAVDATNEILAEAKAWPTLKGHLERHLAAKDPLNVRWAYLMAKACHETLDFDGAKKFAGRTQNAVPNVPPPNLGRLLDFYLHKDRALEIYRAANDHNRPEEYPFRNDDDQPSSLCLRNLTEVRVAIGQFVRGYPGSHPDLAKLREKQKKAGELLQTTPPGPKLDVIRGKARMIDDRIALVMADTDGKMLWRSLVKFLAGYQINSCPDGGRYTLERHQWLDCAKHPGILGERLDWANRAAPTPDEEVQLSRAILRGALAADPKRRACFELQKSYVASRVGDGVQPGEITTSTRLPTGEPLSCPSGKIEAIAKSATTARVRCSYHGSYEEYFEGFGEMKETP
jgi:hypothetical protein